VCRVGGVRGYDHYQLSDDYDAALSRLRASHPELAGEVQKSLMRVYEYSHGVLVEQPWRSCAHESPE